MDKTSKDTTTGDLNRKSCEILKKSRGGNRSKITKDINEFKRKNWFYRSCDTGNQKKKERTGPQKRTTGGILEIGAESVPGPATPLFLGIKAFPKIAKQVRNLVGTGTAVDKVNKEIENKVAQQGVDQTRRDLILSIRCWCWSWWLFLNI